MTQRFGLRLGLKPERLDEYKRYHVRIWPEIADAIHKAGIRNYSIFHSAGELFAYFEYVGPEHELESRLQALARAPRMREWWDLMEPMQIPRADRKPGQWWSEMEEVFHLE
jgi:L-rhamnose mutarotase